MRMTLYVRFKWNAMRGAFKHDPRTRGEFMQHINRQLAEELYMPRLSADALPQQLAQLPGWSVKDGQLTKNYKVKSFAHAVLFIGAIGQLAEAANHHPDLLLHDYNQVTVSVVDHHEGGLSVKCAQLAHAIEALPHKKLDPAKAA